LDVLHEVVSRKNIAGPTEYSAIRHRSGQVAFGIVAAGKLTAELPRVDGRRPKVAVATFPYGLC